MIQPINIKQNQFTLLLKPPYSWKVLIEKSWMLNKNDAIKMIEVDSMELPTGRTLIGVITYIGSGDEILNDNSSTWAYCYGVSEGISKAEIGHSNIVR